MVRSIIGGIMLGIIGLMLLIDPHGVWKAAERWKLLSATEVSSAFVTIARILGGIVLTVSILVVFGVLK